jgi:hypothetical protein
MSILTAEGKFVLPGKEPSAGANQLNEVADWVGKWLVLYERWPEIAAAADTDDELIQRLEAASKGENDLEQELEKSDIEAPDDLADLRELLGRQPSFGTSPLHAAKPPERVPSKDGQATEAVR